jgi:hypothetical protein
MPDFLSIAMRTENKKYILFRQSSIVILKSGIGLIRIVSISARSMGIG